MTEKQPTFRKITVTPYFNNKFPPVLQKNFKNEFVFLWKELQAGLLDACKPGAPDFDKFMAITTKLEVFTSIYSPTEEQRELLVTILLRFLFEEKMTNMNRILIMKQTQTTMGQKVFKNLRINWRAVYNFLDETIFNPHYSLQYASGYTDKLIEMLAKFLKRIRILYPEDAISEVMMLMRQNVQPFFSCVSKGVCFLTLFFHLSSKFSEQYYMKWIPELFEFWSFKNSAVWDKAFLSIFSKLAREHPEINWSPYYDEFFNTFLKLIKNEFPKKTASHIENVMEVATKFLSFYPKDSLTVYMTELLVKMMRPSTFPYSAAYWRKFERIYKTTLPFIHPENQGKWTLRLAQYYNNFCKFYVKRYFKEQELLKQIEELKSNNLPKDENAAPKVQPGLHEIAKPHHIPSLDSPIKDANGDNIDEKKDNNEVLVRKESKQEGEEEDLEELIQELEHVIELEGEEEGDPEGDEDEQIEEIDSEGEASDTSENGEDTKETKKKEKKKKETLEKLEERSKYFLDDYCHEKFIEIMSFVLKNLLYSRDDEVNSFVSKTCRRLLLFKPEVFAPQILDMMYLSFERSDLSYFGFIKVFTLIAFPLFSRTNFKSGLYHLPRILDVTLEHLTSHDHRKTAILLQFYEAVFEIVPIFHQEDLLKMYEKFHGKKDEKDVKSKLNQDEEQDIWQIIEDLSDWAVRFFRRFMEILPILEKKSESHANKIRSLIVVYRKFHSFICQSSPILLNKYADILYNYVEDNVQKFPSKYLSEIIQPLNMAAPGIMTKKMIPLIKNKLLSKLKTPKTEEYSKKPLYSLIQKSSISKEFDYYELTTTNKETLLWMLNILEDLVTYTSPSVLDYTADIELMVFHTLIHDEHAVFEKSVIVLHKLLLSLLSIYPTNLGSLDPADLTKDEFLNIYRKIGKPIKKNIQLTWHQSNKKEKDYALSLFNLLYQANMDSIKQEYLQDFQVKDLTYDFLTQLIDDMHLKMLDTVRIERVEIGRSLVLAYFTFLGLSQRIPYAKMAILNDIQKNFEDRFCFEELGNVRGELCEFVKRFLDFACSKSYIADPIISKTIVDLAAGSFGEDEHNLYMLNLKKSLKKFRKAFETVRSKEIFDNRFLTAIEINLELQKKILGYHFSLDFNEKVLDVPNLLWVFTFHPDESIGELAFGLIDKFTVSLDRVRKPEKMGQLAENTAKMVRERFNFLNENAKELEENEIIKYKGLEIVKNHKESYVDMLMDGAIRNLEYLYPYLSMHMENLLPIIETLISIPKVDDTTSLGAFYRIIRSIDLTPQYAATLQNKFKANNIKPKEDLILKSNTYYQSYQKRLAEKDYQPSNYYNVSHALPHMSEQLEKCIWTLEQEDIHWKNRIVVATLGIIISRFFEPTSEIFKRFIAAVFRQSTSSHFYLRLFSTFAFPLLTKQTFKYLKTKTPVKRTHEDFKDVKMTLDEAFKFHFILKSDYEKYYLKDPFTGFIEEYSEIEVNNLTDRPDIGLPADLIQQVQQKEYFEKLFELMLADVPTKDESSGSTKGSFNFKTIIRNLFARESKLKHHLSAMNSFSVPSVYFLSYIFKHFGGYTIFEKSFEVIQELAKDYNSQEKQTVSAHYFCAVLKCVFFWNESQKEETINKLAQLLLNAVDNVSYENFLTWMFGFINGIIRIDYRLLKPFLQRVLNDPFEKKTSHIQVRYFTLYAIVVKYNGYMASDIAEQLLDLLIGFKPSESRQASEISQNLVVLLKYYMISPVNYNKLKNENIVENIDEIIQANPEKYHLASNYLLYKINNKFKKVTDQLIQWIKEESSPSERKIYLDVFYSMFELFYSEHLSSCLFVYYENIITFLIELNSDESLSLSPETLQMHPNYISFLSKMFYPVEAIPKIISVISDCLNSSNYRVRETALKFYHYFHFNHVYYLQDKSVNFVMDSLHDENPTVRNKAFEIMIDLYKLYTKEEILAEIEKAKKLVEENIKNKNEKEVSKGLYIMMTILLSYPYELEEWTEDLLVILLQTKKSKTVNEKFNKDFVVRFRDQHKGLVNINQRVLSYEVNSDLREISDPSSYFV